MLTAELKYTRTPLKDFISHHKKNIMQRSRKQKLDHFYSLCNYSVPVLDAGVSGYQDYASQVNFFLNNFKFPSYQYTGLAVEPVNNLAAEHPDKTFIRYGGKRFPFQHRGFHWVFSNAVIEHVGDEDAQVWFVNEMLRVSRNVFFTTPNKFFPVESHTDVFFRHWFTKSFYKWCSEHHSYYGEHNLKLLSYFDLMRIMKKSTA